jgi:hypothetical protein
MMDTELSSSKYYCHVCDVVRKGPSGAHFCDLPMQDMGKDWKPGRKGHRTRVFDKRKAPRWYGGYQQLPFEPARRAGQKRARAVAETAPAYVPSRPYVSWYLRGQ